MHLPSRKLRTVVLACVTLVVSINVYLLASYTRYNRLIMSLRRQKVLTVVLASATFTATIIVYVLASQTRIFSLSPTPAPEIHHQSSFHESVHPRASILHLRQKQESYKVGDIVEVDIIGRDHFGRRKVRGGDRVRIWIKDVQNGACAAGSVTDNQDGSYTGVVKLLWSGNVTIVAAVSASRELMELMSYIVQSGRSPRKMLAQYVKGDIIETGNCTPSKEMSYSYKKTCDLSNFNSNLPWYCEMPKTLSCEDWTNYTTIVEIDFSPQEKMILRSVLSDLQLNSTIRLTVTTGDVGQIQSPHFHSVHKPNTTCYNLPPRYTWSTGSPVGYMYKRRWYSTLCTNTFGRTAYSFKKCLAGRKFWMFGDSTIRQIFTYISNFLHLHLEYTKITERHLHIFGSSEDKTVSLFYATHALPYNSRIGFRSFKFAKGTHVYIDNIPANSRDIVIFHFYLHFMAYDPSVVRHHVRKTAQSVKSLKERAPDVKVVVKGPHSFRTVSAIVGQIYDFWSTAYYRVLQEEFDFLANDVIFLDFWDLTVATESWDRHANKTALVPLIHQLMAFVCP